MRWQCLLHRGSSGVSSDRPPGVSFSGVSLVQKPGHQPPKPGQGRARRGPHCSGCTDWNPSPHPPPPGGWQGQVETADGTGGLAGQATPAPPGALRQLQETLFSQPGLLWQSPRKGQGTRRGFLLGLRAWASQFSSLRASFSYPSLRLHLRRPRPPGRPSRPRKRSLLWREPVEVAKSRSSLVWGRAAEGPGPALSPLLGSLAGVHAAVAGPAPSPRALPPLRPSCTCSFFSLLESCAAAASRVPATDHQAALVRHDAALVG